MVPWQKCVSLFFFFLTNPNPPTASVGGHYLAIFACQWCTKATGFSFAKSSATHSSRGSLSSCCCSDVKEAEERTKEVDFVYIVFASSKGKNYEGRGFSKRLLARLRRGNFFSKLDFSVLFISILFKCWNETLLVNELSWF